MIRMNKQNKQKIKGFTLIELLAVIIIISLLALIAVPQVISVIEKSKRGTFEDSVYGIGKATENYVADILLKNGAVPNEKLEFECGKDLTKECVITSKLTGYYVSSDSLSFKGKKMKSGSITIEPNGDITVNYLTDGNYCATGAIDDLTIAKDCVSLDDSAAEIDSEKVRIETTTNSITINLLEGYAEDTV